MGIFYYDKNKKVWEISKENDVTVSHGILNVLNILNIFECDTKGDYDLAMRFNISLNNVYETREDYDL